MHNYKYLEYKLWLFEVLHLKKENRCLNEFATIVLCSYLYSIYAPTIE